MPEANQSRQPTPGVRLAACSMSVVRVAAPHRSVRRLMKSSTSMTWLAFGVVVGLYFGSYFLCVSQVRFGPTRGSHISVAPWYRHIPSWLDAHAIFRPIHLLDRRYLRRSVWQDRAARDGELSGSIVGTRRLLFSIPAT